MPTDGAGAASVGGRRNGAPAPRAGGGGAAPRPPLRLYSAPTRQPDGPALPALRLTCPAPSATSYDEPARAHPPHRGARWPPPPAGGDAPDRGLPAWADREAAAESLLPPHGEGRSS